ncbi:MAG: polysaccharide deacetylase family protein [Sphingomonas sp.]|uniref:polysaccharide deacetylase family protein n=1 Tax=Sphingomonas sp. TaxID=28214 RepID=UPI0025E1CBAD|nr:polysaccharide deacetylase family protein [Sphingomonas sp.]MBX3563896.1 polysaccharide deacetylase family protein [Sphingomonas sp.]
MSPKVALLKAAALSGLSGIARRVSARQLRILCYHGLWLGEDRPYGNCLFMTPAMFDSRMRALRRSGRPVLGLDEAVARLSAGDLPEAAVVITIDDGWASAHSHMLPILERYELPATLYATTWYSGRDLPVINVAVGYLLAAAGCDPSARAREIRRIEQLPERDRLAALRDLGRSLGVGEAWLDRRQFHLMRPAEIADAHARGLDIQMHTHRHIDVAANLGLLAREIEDNRAFLAAAGVPEPRHFCYPSGTWHRLAPAMLAAEGVASATLVDEGLNPPGTDPHALRRFVDGPAVSRAEFHAYLSGSLEYLAHMRRIADGIRFEAPRRAAAASSLLLCAV